jgi:hypothetical protein
MNTLKELSEELATRTGYIALVKEQVDALASDLTVDPSTTDADLIKAKAEAVTALGTEQMALQQVEVDRLTKELADRQTEFDNRVTLGNDRINIEELQFQSSGAMNNAYVNELVWDIWNRIQDVLIQSLYDNAGTDTNVEEILATINESTLEFENELYEK